MKYIGEFSNYDGENIRVLIITHQDETEEKSLVMSGDPVTITYSSSDSIYEPVKGSEATIEILSRSYYFDMYSSTVTGTEVQVDNMTNGINLF